MNASVFEYRTHKFHWAAWEILTENTFQLITLREKLKIESSFADASLLYFLLSDSKTTKFTDTDAMQQAKTSM